MSVKEAIINLNGKTNIFECTSGQKIIIIKYAIKKTFTKSLKNLLLSDSYKPIVKPLDKSVRFTNFEIRNEQGEACQQFFRGEKL